MWVNSDTKVELTRQWEGSNLGDQEMSVAMGISSMSKQEDTAKNQGPGMKHQHSLFHSLEGFLSLPILECIICKSTMNGILTLSATLIYLLTRIIANEIKNITNQNCTFKNQIHSVLNHIILTCPSYFCNLAPSMVDNKMFLF